MGSGITVTVDAKNNTATAFGSAAKGIKTVGEAADAAQTELRKMDLRLDSADMKARRLAQAHEKAAEKARRLAQDLALAKTEAERLGDKSVETSRKLDRMSTDLRFAAVAQEEYRLSASRAAREARETARAYDEVADQARQAARAVSLLGAATALTPAKKGGGGLAGFGAALSEGLLKNGLGGAGAAAEGALGTPVVGPALLAAGIPVAAGAGAFATAALGGGVGLGLGAAGVGAGLAGAYLGDPAKFDAQVQDLAGRFKTRFLAATASWGDTLTGVLKTADQTLQRIPVEKIAAAAQPYAAPLATGAGQGLASVGEGAADALGKVGPIIDRISPKIADLGHAVGDTLRMITVNSEGGADALGDLVDGIGFAIKSVGILILGAETLYGGLRDLAGGAAEAYRELVPYGGLIEDWASKQLGIADSTESLARGLGSVAAEAEGMGGAVAGGIGAFNEASIAANALNDSLTALVSTQLAMSNANIAVAQGWADLDDELKKGAKTLDLSTQAGRDNQKQINEQIGALERQREQTIENGNQTEESIAQANAAYDAGIEKIRQSAYAAGFNKQQVDAMIDSYKAIPASKTTEIHTPGLGTALQQGISLGNALNRVSGDYWATIHVKAAVSGLAAGILQGLGGGLGGKRSGGIAGAAGGGVHGGLTEVGEEGREYVRLPTGSMVYPKANSNQMEHWAGRGGGVVAVELRVTGGSNGLRDLLMEMQRSGDLQILASAIV